MTDCANAFDAAHNHFQIPKLLDAELVTSEPDELSIMTYVSFYKSKVEHILFSHLICLGT